MSTALDPDLSSLLAGLPHVQEHADPICLSLFPTPVGPMVAATLAQGLCLLEFFDRRAARSELADLTRLLSRPVIGESSSLARPHADLIAEELAGYFDGRLRAFTVPLVTPGTPFERRVWDQLLKIPYGQTRSYGQVAATIGSPAASRAVGRANGRNRIAIVVPCHRVIESNGKLRGYGGGLERKRFLLDLEARGAGSLFR
jgi:AraC family transcriptional regulator of adaptative response/methylated-DNA-[protein]-cysteine methyltransferase